MQPPQQAWRKRTTWLIAVLIGLLTACASPPSPTVHPSQTPPGVYVASIATGQTANALTQNISALDASTSQARWNTPLETAGGIGGHWSAPVISNGVVYVTATQIIDQTHATGTLSALNAQDGKLLWQREIGLFASDPVIEDGVVYISAVTLAGQKTPASSALTRSVIALNADSGTIRWQTTIPGDITRLALEGGVVYSIANSLCFDYCSTGGLLTALNASTGTVLWKQEIKAVYHLSLPQFIKGTLIFGTADYHTATHPIPGGAVLAVNSQDGSVRWMVPAYDASSDTPPALANGLVFVGLATIPDPSHPETGTYAVAALSVDSGKVVWHSPTDTSPSLPVLSDGVLYFTSTVTPCNNSDCYTYFASAWSASDGKRLWRVPLDAPPLALRVANGKVYLLMERDKAGGTAADMRFVLEALDTRTGDSAWQTTIQGEANVPPEASLALITGDVLYLTLGGPQEGPGRLIALDARTGAARWTWKTAGFIGGVTVIP